MALGLDTETLLKQPTAYLAMPTKRYTQAEGATTMRHYLVCYEPHGNGLNSAALTKAIQKTGQYWTYMDRIWIVGTDETANQLWDRLTPVFGKNDNVLVIELAAAPDRQGWLPEKAWDWFNKSMPTNNKKPVDKAPTKLGVPYNAYQDGGSVLVIPEGIHVQVIRGAESVHFTEKVPAQSVTPVTPTAPVPSAAPVYSPQTTWTCDFCGHEAPAGWPGGDCPRCGIHRVG